MKPRQLAQHQARVIVTEYIIFVQSVRSLTREQAIDDFRADLAARALPPAIADAASRASATGRGLSRSTLHGWMRIRETASLFSLAPRPSRVTQTPAWFDEFLAILPRHPNVASAYREWSAGNRSPLTLRSVRRAVSPHRRAAAINGR